MSFYICHAHVLSASMLITFFNAILADGRKRKNRNSLDRKSKRRTFCLLSVKGHNNLNQILMREAGSPVRPTHSPAGCASQLHPHPTPRVTAPAKPLSKHSVSFTVYIWFHVAALLLTNQCTSFTVACSILLCSILFYSIMFCSFLFSSVL